MSFVFDGWVGAGVYWDVFARFCETLRLFGASMRGPFTGASGPFYLRNPNGVISTFPRCVSCCGLESLPWLESSLGSAVALISEMFSPQCVSSFQIFLWELNPCCLNIRHIYFYQVGNPWTAGSFFGCPCTLFFSSAAALQLSQFLVWLLIKHFT